MITVTNLPMPGDRCGNLLCSNRVGEGLWTMVEVPGDPAASHRWRGLGLRLSLCSPCAGMVTDALDRKEAGS